VPEAVTIPRVGERWGESMDTELRTLNVYVRSVYRLRTALSRTIVKLVAHQVSWRYGDGQDGAPAWLWKRMARHLPRMDDVCHGTRLSFVRTRRHE